MINKNTNIPIILALAVLLLLGSHHPTNAQDNFWESILNIFRPAETEPKVDVDCKREIEKGDTIMLRWEITDADSAHLQGIKKHIPAKGSMQIHPDSTQYYKFLAYAGEKAHRKYHKVTVYKPEIKYFNIPDKTTDEQKVRISWVVKNAKNVLIPGIADSLSNKGNLTTNIRDSVVTLVAEGTHSRIKRSKKTDITYIEWLKGTEHIYGVQKAKLRWKYKNTKHITIKGMQGEFKPIDSMQVKPDSNKTYQFYIHRTNSSIDTAEHKVLVSPVKIVSLGAPKYVMKKQKFPVFWKVKGASKVKLFQADKRYSKISASKLMNMPKNERRFEWEELEQQGNRTFSLTGDTTFFLVAEGDTTGTMKHRKVKLLPNRNFVQNVDTNQTFGKRPMHCDIISVDQSAFPRQIKMRVVVVDTIGNFVHSLAPPYASKSRVKKYFKPILEEVNGKRKYHDFSIREIRRDTNKTYDMSLVLDHSGSMFSIIDSMQNGAKKFIKNKYKKDKVSVVKYDHFIQRMNESMTNKQVIIDSANLNGFGDFGGGTALYAGIDEGIINLSNTQPSQIVVVFTDGKENSSFLYFGKRAFKPEQIAEKLRKRGIQLVIISYGDAVNKKALNKLAQLGGGKHYNIQRKYNITNVFKELPRVFKYYYEIIFNPINDEGKHKVTLKFNNLKGSRVKNERTFIIGDDYKFHHNFSLPTYLLKEIPVRAEIMSNPQLMARFKFDKHKLEMQYFEVLNKYIEFMIKNPNSEILLAGHTDSKGTAQYCRELSVDRAKAVKEYIMESGIDAYRIHVKGFGKRHPIWDPDKEDFKARENRRVEAVLYKD